MDKIIVKTSDHRFAIFNKDGKIIHYMGHDDDIFFLVQALGQYFGFGVDYGGSLREDELENL
jgi:hypothetical protein